MTQIELQARAYAERVLKGTARFYVEGGHVSMSTEVFSLLIGIAYVEGSYDAISAELKAQAVQA